MTEDQATADVSHDGKSEAGGSGESDFEALIKSFDTPAPRKDTTNQPEPSLRKVLEVLKPVHDFALGEKTRRETQEIDDAVKEIVDFMTEPDETKELPKRFVRGFLAEYSREHPEVQKKFQNRKENPSEWSETLERARKELLEETKSLPGDKVASDVKAAKAAVQGSTQKAAKEDNDGPTPLEKALMPEHEWDAYKRSVFAKAARK